MKLAKVAQYFNDSRFQDAYSGLELGVGQLDVFDDSKRDGQTVLRRVFEVAPGTTMPGRLAIVLHGYTWLVGLMEPDAFKGALIREKYILHQADDLATVQTAHDLLSAVVPLKVYASRVWVRSASELQYSSELLNRVDIFFSRAEDIQQNMLIGIEDKVYIVLGVHTTTAGHQAAVVEQLNDGAVQTATVTTKGGWDPVMEEWAKDTSTIDVVCLRWQSDYEYFSQSTPDFVRGDMQVIALDPQPNGTEIKLDDGLWTVKNCQGREGVNYLHIRRS